MPHNSENKPTLLYHEVRQFAQFAPRFPGQGQAQPVPYTDGYRASSRLRAGLAPALVATAFRVRAGLACRETIHALTVGQSSPEEDVEGHLAPDAHQGASNTHQPKTKPINI